MKCERGGCRQTTKGYDLFDYCAKCGRNLCADHMVMGCCQSIPAKSGMEQDDKPASAQAKQAKEPRK